LGITIELASNYAIGQELALEPIDLVFFSFNHRMQRTDGGENGPSSRSAINHQWNRQIGEECAAIAISAAHSGLTNQILVRNSPMRRSLGTGWRLFRPVLLNMLTS
jgi:hypothetical protein